MTGESAFSPRLLIAWIAGAVVVFAISMYFMGGGELTGGRGSVAGPSPPQERAGRGDPAGRPMHAVDTVPTVFHRS